MWNEVRHDSFCVPAFIALLRQFKIPVVFSEHATYPAIADVTGDFVYLRLQKGEDSISDCLSTEGAGCLGQTLPDLGRRRRADRSSRASMTPRSKKQPRDVFACVIHEAKVRAPHGAMALIERVT